jgi:hypothetical protein
MTPSAGQTRAGMLCVPDAVQRERAPTAKRI